MSRQRAIKHEVAAVVGCGKGIEQKADGPKLDNEGKCEAYERPR